MFRLTRVITTQTYSRPSFGVRRQAKRDAALESVGGPEIN
jgi:hypothetical protein